MGITTLPAGKDAPSDIFVHIEIPQGSNIKYEIDEASGILMVDRFVPTPMAYPLNYGYIPQTLGLDGDAVDVLVLAPQPLLPNTAIRCRPVGVILMEDESGQDEKIIAVPHSKVTRLYEHVQELADLPPMLMEQLKHFFEHYKDLEPEKWVKLTGTGSKDEAMKLIQVGMERFSAK